MRLVWGTVAAVVADDADAQRLLVTLDDGLSGQPAVCYPSLSGVCSVGDSVLCNTTAVDLSLGTGGDHIVVARGGPGVVLDDRSAGHIMKLRYTPLQRDVTVAEEPASGHHATMAEARSLEGAPVVCCGLHSQVAVVAAAVKERAPTLRVVYVMTDEAALPIGVSRLVPRLLDTALLDLTITCGQAFGGGLEAVNRHSGMLAARHVAEADVIVVGIGPGIVGTATAFGHGGVAQGEAINAAGALGGVPVAVLRVSFADLRSRHVPVSHQTLCALSEVALTRAVVAVPSLEAEDAAAIDAALTAAGVWSRHERRVVPAAPLPDMRGLAVRTMGRSPDDDPAFFHAAAAAGRIAAEIALATRP